MNDGTRSIIFKDDIEELLKQNKRNQNFWSQISKEIRTSLSGITGITEDIKRNLYKTEELEYKVNEIQYNSEVLFEMANSIVDYSYLSTNRFELKPVVFYIKDLMTDLMMSLSNAVKRKKINLLTNIHDIENIQLNEDQNRIKQILKCYTEYAIRHTNYDGSVYITIECSYSDDNRVHLCFIIKATGAGFYQAISTEAEHLEEDVFSVSKFAGNGIERYVCDSIIKKMNGTTDYLINNESESQMRLMFEFNGVLGEETAYSKESMFEDERIIIFDPKKQWSQRNSIYLNDIGVRYDIAVEKDQTLEMIGQAEDDNMPYNICLFRAQGEGEGDESFVSELRDVFGDAIILIEVVKNGEMTVGREKQEGVDYLIDTSWVRSTIFDVLMRIKKADFEKRKENFLEEQKYNFENRRVLLAEDVALNADIIVKMLNQVNVNVTVAVNGLEAVSLFNRKPEGYFNCILMDINMPVMDGYMAAKEIRNCNKEYGKSIPIYAMTANALSEDVQKSLNVGMDGHISKPVSPEVLYKVLNNVFDTIENDEFVNLHEKAKELIQKNDELQNKAEHDHLTGLLNRHGFERKVNEYIKLQSPIGLVLVDLDKFKGINDTYGHQVGDRVLQKLAIALRKNFRVTDDVVRFGGDEFAVILNNILDEREFVIKIVERVNQELSITEDGLPAFSISTGAAFSEHGYSEELYNHADQALYFVKEHGRCGCRIFSEKESTEQGLMIEKKTAVNDIDKQTCTIQGAKILHLENDDVINQILQNNNAVGVICGYYRNQLPVCSISNYTLQRLGYTEEEFYEATDGYFERLVYNFDISLIYDTAKSDHILKRKLRLLHKDGSTVWYNVVVKNTCTSAGEEMWFASFREIDGNLLKELSHTECSVIGIMNADNGKISFEKGIESLPGYRIVKGMNYDYDTMLKFSINKTVPEEDQNLVYEMARMETIISKLNQDDFYQFTEKRMNTQNKLVNVRYSFRYINYQADLIICTQEYIS